MKKQGRQGRHRPHGRPQEIVKYKALYLAEQGEVPKGFKMQMEAVKAVFRSWTTPAIVYRRMNDIPSDWGASMCDDEFRQHGTTPAPA